jgi:flagellar basal body-associated protein FliL
MKGMSSLIVVIILVLIVVAMASAFLLWGTTSSESIKTEVEEKQEYETTGRGATFIITNVSFNRGDYTQYPNVTILNNGKADLNLLELEIYLNDTRHNLEPWDTDNIILRPGESAVMKIMQ